MPKMFSFDIGHASIGWAAFDIADPRSPQLEGCGTLIFPADDCLASQRRTFRRQRRHIRSTRVRIARMKDLIERLGVLTREELDEPGGAAPWKLAAGVLCGHRLLSWRELWDVLRWYAHNRGYDGNRKWSRTGVDPADTEKEKRANELMNEHNTATMAETICARLGIDPRSASKVTPHRAYKTLDAAFPRDVVLHEVRRILERHVEHLAKVDDRLIESLCAEDNAVPGGTTVRDHLESLGWTQSLPNRYVGGLLFGQSVPRFDNRIIGVCPVSSAKLPLKSCREFREFRWAMIVANVRVPDAKTGARELSADERSELTRRLRAVGSFSAVTFQKEIQAVTGGGPGNVVAMMTDPNAADALVLDPALQFVLSNTEMKSVWPMMPASLQHRILRRLNRQKLTTWGWVASQPSAPADLAERVVAAANAGRRKNKDTSVTWEVLSLRRLSPAFQSGRAPYSRQVMQQATAEAIAGRHPAAPGGVLFMSEERIARERTKQLDELTNNHLVRHRLRMLDRLISDMVKRYANGDAAKVTRCVVEVVRDLAEFSGKSNQDITKELNARLKNFNDVAKKLAADLQGTNVPIGAGLIRKARIADDLGWTCPYTGMLFDAVTLAQRGIDLDHVVPRSLRPSDSLDSLVVTFPAVNKWKGNRTARQFVQDEQGKPVPGMPQLSIVTLQAYDAFVNRLAGDSKPHRFTPGHGTVGDKMRRWNRKQRLMQMSFDEPSFTPRDLTVTSHLTRLACRQLEKSLPSLQAPGTITSLPGGITAVVRKAWRALGCLASAAPLVLQQVQEYDANGRPVLDPNGTPKLTTITRPKAEIRSITHLHHALDAVVMGLAAVFLPRDGKLWEQLITGKVVAADIAAFRADFGWNKMLRLVPGRNGGAARLDVDDLPTATKKQIEERLAERRVVRHIPADMRGARLELNPWRVLAISGDRVTIVQRGFDPKDNDVASGARRRRWKRDEVSVQGVIGLGPGKLKRLRAVLVISENYGVAILDPQTEGTAERFEVIPFHEVRKRLSDLTARNNGVRPLIIRNGNTIQVRQGTFAGRWRVFSVKNNQAGVSLDLGQTDTVKPQNKTPGHKINVRLSSLVSGGLTVDSRDFTGCW